MTTKKTLKKFLNENLKGLETDFMRTEISDSTKDDPFRWIDDEEAAAQFQKNAPKDIYWQCVDQHGGEGEGEDYYSVYEFGIKDTEEKVFVKFQGWYQSYNGYEFNEWFFVEPKEVVVTEYVKG